MTKKIYIIVIFLFAMPITLSNANRPTKRVIALDPGALHGYMQALVLEALEREIDRPISEFFDLFGGTSTGAVIAGLLTHGTNRTPAYAAKQVREFYELYGKEILGRRTINLLSVLGAQKFNRLRMEVLRKIPENISKELHQVGLRVGRSRIEEWSFALERDGIAGLMKEISKDLAKTELLRLPADMTVKQLVSQVTDQLEIDQIETVFGQNYFFDAERFKALLSEKMGPKTRFGEVLKPTVIFTLAFPLSPEDVVQQWVERNFRLRANDSMVQPVRVAFFSGEERFSDAKLVDVVYASSAELRLFPPQRIDLAQSQLTSFIDGAAPNFSNEEATLKFAQSLWPQHNIELYTFGTKEEHENPAIPKELTIDQVRIFDLRVTLPSLDRPRSADPSDANFMNMKRAAQKFIESSGFKDVLNHIRAIIK